MSKRLYNLPPLKALAAFEAAARHRSFKRAAAELNVTPGAISHQVKALETELGLSLFHRVHRGVELSEDGSQLFKVMRGAFLNISGQLDDLRNRASNRGVTIGATTAMSSLWLMPAISQFWRSQPDLRVNQVVSDLLDFGSTKPDLVISYGPYTEPEYLSDPLFRDDLVPLCAPDLAAKHRPTTLNELAQLPLIHLEAPDTRWTTWARWFAELGYSGPLRRGTKVNNYMIALQAAQDGVGMVLGWKQLVAPYLHNGSLVSFDRFSVPAPTSFFLSCHPNSANQQGVDALADWIRTTSSQSLDEVSSS